MPEQDEFDDLGFQRRLAELEAARARARRILDVPEGADETALRAAYRRLARRHHPDRSPNDPDARQRFLLIRAAYELLAHGRLSPLLTSEETPSEGEPTGKYNMDSEWGHFLWWRDKFLDAWKAR
jgi:hypothetical protein